MPRLASRLVSPSLRLATGCIATLVRDGGVTTRHFPGGAVAVAEFCDRDGWRVLTYSTPDSIWRDVQGSRSYTKRGRRYANAPGRSPASIQNAVSCPERLAFGRIGRLDVLA